MRQAKGTSRRARGLTVVAACVAMLLGVSLAANGETRALTPKDAQRLAAVVDAARTRLYVAIYGNLEVATGQSTDTTPLLRLPSDDVHAVLESREADRAASRQEVVNAARVLSVAYEWRDAWAKRVASSPASPIFGPSLLAAEQLAKYAQRARVPYRASVPLLDLAQLYIDEGLHEGVRGDVAFAQAILETGTFSRLAAPNNFAGLGACSGCRADAFTTARDGVRAQIQLLRWRTDATLRTRDDFTAKPATIPARFLRTRHGATSWTALGGRWSLDPQYGNRVYDLYLRMLATAPR